MVEEAEMEVAEIMVELPYLMARSQSSSLLEISVKWNTTKRRNSSVLLQSQQLVPAAAPTPAAGLNPTTATCEIEKERPSNALSPATPLLFSPSESDDKTEDPPKRRVSLKRKVDEYLKEQTELTETNWVFKEEIKKIKSCCDQQKAINLKLEAVLTEREMTHDLQTPVQQPHTHLGLNTAMESSQPAVQTDVQNQQRKNPYVGDQQPSVIQHQPAQNSESSQYPFGRELLMIRDSKASRPALQLDLNVPLVESFTVEFENSEATTRTAAAEARRKRIQICRSKTANKLRIPIFR